ncbi:hypothetical protein [Xanthobacter pseudotagetidis]|uniref:hypothetical protein n=1 Tax=Xanthobacter pseudotagetidis TaxID=3119911 RepID=UPI0037281F51
MRAFAIETALLLALIFAIGFAIGLYLRARRTRAAVGRVDALPAIPAVAAPAAGADAETRAAAEARADADDVAPAVAAESADVPPPAVQGELLLGTAEPSNVSSEPATAAARPAAQPQAKTQAKTQAKPAAKGKADADHPGRRPPAQEAPEAGSDDLKLIKGIGPQNEARLNALGIHSLSQIAGWTEEEALWVGSYLAFPGRIEREDWIGQAKALIAGVKLEDLRLPPRRPS